MSLKQYIVRMKKKIDTFRESDAKFGEMMSEHAELKSSLKSTFAQIQSLGDDFEEQADREEQLLVLDETMGQLSELIKLNEEDTIDYCNQKFPDFSGKYPAIFKLFLKGDVDQVAFNHVLDTVTLLEQGQISLEKGKELGYHKFMKF